MKNHSYLYLFLFSLIFTFNLDAQKLRDKRIYINYVQLPSEKLPDHYTTYSVKVSGSAVQLAGFSSLTIAQGLKMDGFKQVDHQGGEGGHLRFIADAGYISTGAEEIKTGTQKRKDSDGNEVTSTYYYYTFPFTSSYSYKVVNENGEILATGSYPAEKNFDSERYDTRAALTKDRNRIINELRKKYAKEVIANLERSLQSEMSKFDFVLYKDYEELFVTRSHKSEGQFEKHYEKVSAILNEAEYTASSDILLEQLQPSMDFYAQYANSSPRGDKKKKRLYRAGNYNLALLYFATDQFEKAEEHAQKVLDSEGKDAKSKRLIRKIEEIREKQELHGITTIHYQRNLEDVISPKEEKQMEAELEEIRENSITAEGLLYRGGEEISGTVSLDKEADELIFGPEGNVRFFGEERGQIEEIDLTNEAVTVFYIGERKFMKIPFSPSARGQQERQTQILEILYASDKIKLYKYYPVSSSLDQERNEFALQKSAEEHPISLESTAFLFWEKGLAAYFQDCEDLKLMCEEGKVAKNQEDLIKAVRIYSELCN